MLILRMKTGKSKVLGFTLLEILMVVAVVAILAAVAFPAMVRQKEQSKISMTKANMETIRMAISMYYENEETWPNNTLSDLVTGSPSGVQYLPQIPKEGITGSSAVTNIFTLTGGWCWQPSSHRLYINLTGTDINGEPYGNY